jgi:hypothetical protein
MVKIRVEAIDRQGIPLREITPRLRSQLNYFASTPDASSRPELGENEYWFDREDVVRWLDDGVIHLVSPLDTAHTTEVELSEEQEEFLSWLQSRQVCHVRVIE